MDCYVPARLQSIAMPLKLVQEDTAAPVSANQSDVLPSLTEYTPRMVEVSIKDTDKQQGQSQQLLQHHCIHLLSDPNAACD